MHQRPRADGFAWAEVDAAMVRGRKSEESKCEGGEKGTSDGWRGEPPL